jgi:hypothetical protein
MTYRIPQSDANYGEDPAAHAWQGVRPQAVPPKNRRKKPDLSSKRGWRWRFLSATHKLHSRRPGAASCARQKDSSRIDRATDIES